MVRAHAFQIAFATLLLGGALLPAQALQLGEGKAQVLQRHGAPGAEDRAKNVAIYFWDGWSAELEFKNDSTNKLIFRRNSYLTDTEITSLLRSNGGVDRWKETTAAEEQMRQWVRDDGATATCMATRPLMITFQAGSGRSPGVPRYSTEAKPQNVVPPSPSPASTTPPTFPKPLSSDPAPRQLANEPSATPRSQAPASPRALPKLQSEEVATEPPPKKASAQEPKARVVNPWQLPEAAVDPLDDRGTATAGAAAEPPKTGGAGWIAGIVALLAAAGAGAYWFKRRQTAVRFEPITSMNMPTRSVATPSSVSMSASAANPSIDALRADQRELLIGEIFRRAGYMVELSAAVSLGDSIDLTLRRDSETILVQCKHWKNSRVGEKEIREFHTAMMTNGAPRGIFVTAGNFSREAQDFAAGKDIELMDRAALEESIGAISRPGEDFCGVSGWIEEFAAQARIFDPECPVCQGSMVIRPSRTGGSGAWTCRNHPRCPGRREPRLDLTNALARAH